MSAAEPGGMKEDAAPKESDSAFQEVQPQPASSGADRQEWKKRRARMKIASRYVAMGVVIVLLAATIQALVEFFYGERRDAKFALKFEIERRERLEVELADVKVQLAKSMELERAVSSELAAVKAALTAEREKRMSIGTDNADQSKRIAKLTESLSLVQQVLAAPDAKLAKAKDALDQMRKHKDFMKGVELGRILTGDDLSVLADILTAPDQLRSSKELTAATVEAYESRIETVDSIVRSALAAEKYLPQRPAPEDSPSPRN
jgi:septal ring factor EnvC (AmiA/AmiB activator)